MPVRRIYTTPRGAMLEIGNDHLELAQKIQNGDGIIWVGDPALSVNWDTKTNQYCIVRLCEDNVTRPVAYYPPDQFDLRVLHDLARGDMRYGKNDVLKRVEQSQLAYEKEQARKSADADHELADRLEFIWRKYLPDSAKV